MPLDTRVSVYARVVVPRCLALVRRVEHGVSYVGLCDVDLDDQGHCPDAARHKPTT